MLNVRKILYPTDFSECSKQALNQAIFLAESLNAELFMLHAVVLHADDVEDKVHDFPGRREMLQRMFEVADSELARLAGERSTEPLRIRQERRRGYSPASVIADYAVENDIDLIVMGTHGRRAATRFLLGSTAEEILRRAACPVLTISPSATNLKALNKILVPVDFSGHSPRGVATASALADKFGAELSMIHVIEWPAQPDFYGWSANQGALDDLTRRAGAELETLLAEVGGPVESTRRRVLIGHPASQVVRLIEEEGFDLVVLPTHGLTGLNRWLMGSNAQEVARQAGCPVLSLSPHSKAIATKEPEKAATVTA